MAIYLITNQYKNNDHKIIISFVKYHNPVAWTKNKLQTLKVTIYAPRVCHNLKRHCRGIIYVINMFIEQSIINVNKFLVQAIAFTISRATNLWLLQCL